MAEGFLTHVAPDVEQGFKDYLDRVEPETAEQAAQSPPAPEPEPEPEPVPEPEPEVEATADEEISEELSPESAAEPQAADADDADDDVIRTVADLAESFEVEEAELLSQIQVADAAGKMVALSDVVNAYRVGPDLDSKVEAEIESTRAEMRREHDAGLESLTQLTARLVQRVEQHREPEGGWERLRQENPGEYIRQREAEEADRRDAREAIGYLEAAQQQREAEDEKAAQVYAEEQGKVLFSLRPEWRGSEEGKLAFADIQGYLNEVGFPVEQQQALVDARSIQTVWEASQYRKLQSAKPGAKKRLRGLPKRHVRSTARDESRQNETQNKKRAAQLDKFRSSGKIEDGLEFFAEHIE